MRKLRRYEGVLHPHHRHRRRLVVEQHAGVGREALPEHQPLLHLRRGGGEFDGEFMRAPSGDDGQGRGRKRRQLREGDIRGKGEQQQREEEKAATRGHGVRYDNPM